MDTPVIARHARHRERGVTLIELVIAIAIAVFLLAGLFTIVSNTRRVYGAQAEMAQLQDTERMALTMLGDVIQESGYFPNPTVNTATSAFPAAGAFALGQALTGVTNTAAPGDTISVRFMSQSGDGMLTCTGTTWAGGGTMLYTNVYSILPDANGTPNLACNLNGAAAATMLVPGVTNIQVLYGVKTNFAVNNGAVDSYMTATQVSAAAAWPNVISVKVTLTFMNPLFGQPNQPQYLNVSRVVAVMRAAGVTD